MQQKKQNVKTFLNKRKGFGENPQLSLSTGWPKAKTIWPNFHDNFFSHGGFKDTNFGDWKSTIEERSNSVLNGYNSGLRRFDESTSSGRFLQTRSIIETFRQILTEILYQLVI